MNIGKVIKNMTKILPAKSAIRFSIEKRETGLFDNKIGGTPYFPKEMEYPRGKNNEFEGQPLTLLVQLNFEKLPHIPDFPEKGILQFFIAADDLYGMSPECSGDSLTKQDNFRVIYHENIITDESMLLSADEIPKYEGDEECYLPFDGEYLLVPQEPSEMLPTAYDFRFGEAFVESYNEVAEDEIEDLWDLDEEIIDDLYDIDFPEAVLGGYPIFTQDDPRYGEELEECDTLLFELDSAYDREKGIDIMWGDNGTGSFFIPRKRLKELDFSKVLYNYDCS